MFMLHIDVSADPRYKIDRRFIRSFLKDGWEKRLLPSGKVSVAFVGSRKARELAKKYLHDDTAHPVITVPHGTKGALFPGGDDVIGEIVICFSQVVIFAAEQDKEINTVISQFLDHAMTVLSNVLS
ncbi:hypothetical protein COU89_00950 [Candidatus Roizmanbacteria bacterium CG10_big_fil_rev_8_21_14_0_10_45_7]|uniref:rRNA maturation RNase YbeY n=1 Tax=Candidatus Roizmanbacteria bacterium CG10_big_fil_rev_8_21_14_0_10_45_7 TaxID=1974854 RepID=A0A2M8KVD4_9BACT|nr:MAG: hypothetical protein COU89_00950 [Candidatus Roizmanbacteria bacterium CG10_big_fil_rev_8_21_14_0_10_45_7]